MMIAAAATEARRASDLYNDSDISPTKSDQLEEPPNITPA